MSVASAEAEAEAEACSDGEGDDEKQLSDAAFDHEGGDGDDGGAADDGGAGQAGATGGGEPPLPLAAAVRRSSALLCFTVGDLLSRASLLSRRSFP